MAKRSYLHLLIIMLIACTLLGKSLAIPLSRTRQVILTREAAFASNNNINQQIKHKTMEKMMTKIENEVVVKGRRDVELTDYSPTGPNPYHTPKPPRG